MNRHTAKGTAVACLALLTSMTAIQAQGANKSKREIGIRGWILLNAKARFGGLGGVAPATNPGPSSAGGVDRSYDDGFNHLDISGNADGLTWNWGYLSPAQIVGDSVVLSSSRGLADGLAEDSGVHPAFEFYFRQALQERLGFQGSLGYARLEFENAETVGGTVLRSEDAFPLNGIIPPAAPFSGSFQGPGPLIGDTPQRSNRFLRNRQEIRGVRHLKADLFLFSVGPYFKPMKRGDFEAIVSAGISLARLDGDFAFTETAIVPDASSQSRSGQGSKGAFLPGFYAEASANFNLTSRFGIQGGFRYQLLEAFSEDIAAKSVEVQFDAAFAVFAGVTFSF